MPPLGSRSEATAEKVHANAPKTRTDRAAGQHLCGRTDFSHNRTAALAERQQLGAGWYLPMSGQQRLFRIGLTEALVGLKPPGPL